MKVMHDQDIQPGVLNGKRVAIIGFGSQGHAHALNLRDSGCDVVVGLRPEGKSWTAAQHAGLTVYPVAEAVAQADVVMILIPDEQQPATYAREIAPYLRRGAYLAFAHGFCIHFKRIQPPADANVFLVAPKGPGRLVRRQYEAHAGVPCLIAVHQDPAGNTRDIALAYAGAIGGGRAGIIETSFREETETDLFGEQAVLCGGLSELVRAGFETLVAAGYAPEMAYFECLHEVKLITDLMYERGITGMRQAISNTAKYGDVTRGRRIVNEQTRQEMQRILAEIQSGRFADEWMDENAAGQPQLRERMRQDAEHQIEQVGRALRGMMPWLAGAPAPGASTGPGAQGVPADGHVARVPEATGPRLRPAATSAPRASAASRPGSPPPGVHTRHDGLVDPSSSWPGFEAPPSWYLHKPDTGPTQG